MYYMNVYDFALDFENEHRKYYLERAEESNGNLKQVFTDLAEEERKHAEIVKQLSQNKEASHVESDILPRAREALEEMASDLPESILPTEQVDIYKQAEEMERKSYQFYRDKAEQTDKAFIRKTFERLAEEEKKHQNIMRNLVEFVNRPNTWLDDAEWYHHEEY